VVALELRVDEGFQFVGLDLGRHDGAQGVDDEIKGMMVLEERGVLREDHALLGVVHVAFDGDQPLLADLVEHLAQHGEGLEVVGLRVSLAGEHLHDSREDGLDDLHGRGDDEAATAAPPMMSSSTG